MKSKLSFLILIIFILMACTSVHGNKQITNNDITSQIKPGVSTKVDVKTLVGDPMEVEFTDTGIETWKYVYSKGRIRSATYVPIIGIFAGGIDSTHNTLTIRFDSDGIVEKIGRGHTVGAGGGLQDLNK